MTDEERYGQEIKTLLDNFKAKMKDACEETLSDLYQDIVHWAPLDADINYRNHLQDALSAEIQTDILKCDGSIYSWAATYRMNLLKKRKDELQNAIITQLQETVRNRDDRIRQLEERFSRGAY
jgi:hypothetical protein